MTEPRHVHFVGIGGIHMSGLARILLGDGVRVSGSDLTPSHLTAELATIGATIAIGHDAANIGDADLIVRTIAVKDDNPELIAARNQKREIITRAQMVARIAQARTTLTVAGSHGKTTTSTMLTLMLREADLDPSFILGGEAAALTSHAARGTGNLIVLEADEYGRAFHEYSPTCAVITNLEADHLDYYESEEALQDAFLQYASTLVLGGTLILGGESRCLTPLLASLSAARPDIQTQSFGLMDSGTWNWAAANLVASSTGTTFDLQRDGKTLTRLSLAVPGAFNVRNALAAAAVALQNGASTDAVQAALSGFSGVDRRFQIQGEVRGVTVIDDYAHHPTEIAATIAAARERFPNRRLVILFQPHTYSRSAYLLEGFQTCFQDADRLYLAETYAARETPDAGLAAVDLTARIIKPAASYLGSLDQAAKRIAEVAEEGDVVFTMGAGDIERTGPEIVARLEES